MMKNVTKKMVGIGTCLWRRGRKEVIVKEDKTIKVLKRQRRGKRKLS